ncbi:MAG: bifunctional pyr operon transcriptional regulator/uracil phosphoribosyltransferase PyrR [Terriglobia bacterium]
MGFLMPQQGIFPTKLPSSPNPKGRVTVREVAELMSSTDVGHTIDCLARQILERNQGARNISLIGIRRRGVPLAERLRAWLAYSNLSGPPLGILDISFYTDDLTKVARKPIVRTESPEFSVDGKTVILVDDVLYSGKTVFAALETVTQLWQPDNVQLCVLIDRGHRQLPIQADYIGRCVQTSTSEVIEVRLREIDQEERVVLCEKNWLEFIQSDGQVLQNG